LADYVAMSRAFDADLIDYQQAAAQAGWFGRLLGKIGGNNLLLAWVCFLLRKEYRLIFTDGEQVGIPLAFLLKFFGFGRRPAHLMIVHILSVGKKMKFFDWFGIQSHVDLFLCYSTWQVDFIRKRWRVPVERAVFTPFMVDHRFFAPEQVDLTLDAAVLPENLRDLPGKRPYICSVGLEFRDYPTLMAAVEGLEIHVVIAAGSPWSKREDSTQKAEVPDNVTVRRFTQAELRYLYLAAEFVVMPLYDVEFQAGVTAILEGMAMGKAILCSRTPGQTDVIVEGVHGRYVPPGYPAALRVVIEEMLADPEGNAEMGRNGRRRIVEEMSLDCYVDGLHAHVRRYLAGG
jgi:glycosyltransferase involved in cell wall biosynthesis